MATDTRDDTTAQDDTRMESVDTKVIAEEPVSDNDSGERPVRNKLKETSITAAPMDSATDVSTQPQQEGETSRSSSRGRKRSFNEESENPNEDDGGHRRKRSRDSKNEDEEDSAQTEAASELPRKILSPKKKRSRDQLDKESKTEGAAGDSENKTSAEEGSSETAAGEPEKKRHRDASKERDSDSATSAFANTSTVSPFGALGASKPKEEAEKAPAATSSSAFAASSLSAFAGSEQSPFGAIGASTPSVFKSPATEAAKPAATGFASAAGTSGFAALGSGFSGFSGGFGSGGLKGGLTSFAAPGGPSIIGSTSKDKPFGAAEEEKLEEEKEEIDIGPGEFEQDKTDERFFERPIETGEEEEKTYFSSKAKLFQFSNREWKERGIGTFKVNVKITDGKEDKKATRLIMRADGVLRVMLNTPIFKGMTVGDASGNEPKSKQIHLASLEDDRSVPILLRMPSEDLAKELYNTILELLEHQ